MATLFLAGASGETSEYLDYPKVRIEQSALHDAHRAHSLCDDPRRADIIFFANNNTSPPLGLSLCASPLFRKFRAKCLRFDSSDNPSPFIGGLCASWTAHHGKLPGLAAGWCYHHPTTAEPFIKAAAPFAENTPYLWSFKGSRSTHPVRNHLFETRDAGALVEDTSRSSLNNLMGVVAHNDKLRFFDDYINLLRDSLFIACPRGVGASSMRIFEAMRIGRAPVIISDAWTPPPFVDWARCSIRIPENEAREMPALLRARASEARALGAAARAEWERVFGERGLFHHTVEACLGLLREREKNSFARRARRYGRLLRADSLREILRFYKHKLRK